MYSMSKGLVYSEMSRRGKSLKTHHLIVSFVIISLYAVSASGGIRGLLLCTASPDLKEMGLFGSDGGYRGSVELWSELHRMT